jgi:transposase-like protein
MFDLTNPIFHDENAARDHLEKLHWPNGPFCPHCGSTEVARVEGKKQSHRPGLFYCNGCTGQFTVTVGTVMERSKIPLHKWIAAFHLLTASKKGISAHQIHRMLGISYKSAWFLCHRIREAMDDKTPGPIGGEGKVVEADETYVGGKAKNRAFAPPPKKHAVLALIERDGEVRSRHIPDVTGKNVRKVIVTNASRKSWLMSDESPVYKKLGREFKGHGTVNHSADEFVRHGGFMHTNTIENFFSIFKRGLTGVYHAVSEQHLGRYLNEFTFRHNNRVGLGVDDTTRAEKAIKGAKNKRLTYNQTDFAAYA